MAELVFSQFEAVVKTAVNPEIVQQFEQSKTLYNRFHKGAPKTTNSRGFRIPFYDRPPASDGYFGEGGQFPAADNPQFSDMRIFPARYATAFRISGDVFDNMKGDALIDKISDLFMLQTEAAKKTLDFQVAGTRTGSIAGVASAVTGDNGTITCSTTVANGSTFGSYKIKEGARLHVVDGTTNIARGAPTTITVVDPGGNNRATNVVTFDTVPVGTTAGDYLVYENSALKAPHGLKDLINNDTGEIQGQLRSRHPHLKAVAINAAAQRLQVGLLVQIHYSLRYRQDDTSNVVIMSSPTAVAGYMSNGYNLQRFDGGGGTYRADFKDVQFGDLRWETHVAIDPDRTYGIDLRYIDIYELMRFGAYAKDGQTTRMFTSAGNYYDSWIGFIGCKYDLGATKFGAHWVLYNLDTTGLPGPGVAFA
jgi:hypothetical protein